MVALLGAGHKRTGKQPPPAPATAALRSQRGRQMAAWPAGGTDANARSAAEATGTNARGAAEQEEQRGLLPRSGHGVPHGLGNKSIRAQAGGMVEDRRGHHDFVRSGLRYEGR